MKTFGIDISEWQDGFNFDKAISEGVEFVILRGADKLYKDRCFEGFYKTCRSKGIPVGVYHYTRSTTPAEARQEARFLIENVLQGKRFEYPIYMDVEASNQKKVGKKQLTDTVVAFCEEIKAAGYLPGVYTSLSFLKSYLDDSRLDPYEKWIAQWYRYCEYGNNLGMWQFGGETNLIRTNKVAGVVCDQDYCYFDYPEIIKKRKLNGYTASDPKPEPEKEEGFDLKMRVLKKGCTGEDVRALQILLKGNGWNGGKWGSDGNYGAETEQAVTAYQKKKKLQVDGMAGPETMSHLLGIA